ncbi:MAG TPA: alpha-amylase family glycosyl hydrolase [bacterium]|jgi:alpha-glucosidase
MIDPNLFHWWQSGIIYQIYPRSFQDSNGDGIGDLPGILQRLDYLRYLGVDAIWLSPIFPSPMADFGYDVSDYTAIDPMFGTLEDFDRLLATAHGMHIRLLLDFVPNHTSDQHPWFIASRSARTHPKRDWYIWRDPAPDGGPPNNWLSNFGGSAWECDDATGQYYFHAFLKEQPDLNWRNPAVQEAMLNALRFWLDRGVDGFRVDVVWHLIKDEEFRDNPRNPEYHPGQSPHREFLATFTSDRPEVHDVIAMMRKLLDEYDDRMMVGEVYLPLERLMTYYGGGAGIHMPFNFQLIELPWNARLIGAAIQHYESLLPSYGWPNWVLGNHDTHRIATRTSAEQARVAAMLLLTLRGTPTMYYGDEIGMHDVPIPPEAVQDPFEKNVPGLGLGRDPERTPMQWDERPAAGFTTSTPWLLQAADAATQNVAAEMQDPHSTLSLYRALIALRRKEEVFVTGRYVPVAATDHLLCYVRQDDRRRLLVVLNLSPWPQTFALSGLSEQGRVLLSTQLDRADESVSETVSLREGEGLIIELP